MAASIVRSRAVLTLALVAPIWLPLLTQAFAPSEPMEGIAQSLSRNDKVPIVRQRSPLG